MFGIGSKVQVRDFPPAAAQAVPFDWNGLTGTVMDKKKIGFGLGGNTVYSYRVLFDDIKIPDIKRDPVTGKLKKKRKKGRAENWFDEAYLIKIADAPGSNQEFEDDEIEDTEE